MHTITKTCVSRHHHDSAKCKFFVLLEQTWLENEYSVATSGQQVAACVQLAILLITQKRFVHFKI